MQQALLDHLRVVTEEEQRILDGVAEVDKDLYTSGKDFTVDSAKMLSEGKLIAVRTHTRFVHFPSHRHNYIEVLYVCQGQLTNIIGGKEVVIHAGELLFLNQYTRHEILPAGEEDIAINFMILPEFFVWPIRWQGVIMSLQVFWSMYSDRMKSGESTCILRSQRCCRSRISWRI